MVTNSENNSMPPLIIRDGYTCKGYIKEAPRLHRAVRFYYRPMLMADRDVIRSEVQRVPGALHGTRQIQLAIQARLVSWDIVEDGSTETVPIVFENVACLHPEVSNKMYSIISGYAPSDPDPDDDPVEVKSEDQEYLERLLDANGSGRSIGFVSEEADAKN